MKSEELRLNNYVMCRGALSKVSSINEDSIGYKKRTGIGEDRIPLHLVNPIKLTEEWLLKLGVNELNDQDVFRVNYVAYHEGTNTFKYCIGYYYNEEGYIENIYKEIEYVHSLQNIHFAFTNEEL